MDELTSSNATIQNVVVTNASAVSATFCGLLAHIITSQLTITNLTESNVSVQATSQYVGGIAGSTATGCTIQINNVTLAGTLTGVSCYGVIFGYADNLVSSSATTIVTTSMLVNGGAASGKGCIGSNSTTLTRTSCGCT